MLEALSQLTSPSLITSLSSDELQSITATVSCWSATLTTVAATIPSAACAPLTGDGCTGSKAGISSNAVVTEEGLLTDLHRVCGLIKVCSYNKVKTDEFVTHILEEHSNNVPCYATACKLMLCIPVTSVECERAFSTQNRIKTKLRNRLDDDRVNVLMKLNMHWVPQMKYLTLLRQCVTGKRQNKGVCTFCIDHVPPTLICLYG